VPEDDDDVAVVLGAVVLALLELLPLPQATRASIRAPAATTERMRPEP
jgi:hypothetical protein